MTSDDDSDTSVERPVAPGGPKKSKDRIAYAAIGGYSLINILWILWVFSGNGYGLFYTAILIGVLVPILGIVSLVLFQRSSRQNRFSPLANVLAWLTLVGWLLVVWCIIAFVAVVYVLNAPYHRW